MKTILAFLGIYWIRVILLSCAVAMAVSWVRSYEPPRQPRSIVEVLVPDDTTHLPRQSLIHYRSDHSCIYASVVNGWIRIGSIDIQEPFRVPPKNDSEAWMWIGNARFPDPKMVGAPLVTKWFHGIIVTASVPFASGRLRGAAIPCWLLVIALMTLPVVTVFKMVRSTRRLRSEGLCKKCGYNLAGLTEQRCPECGKVFAPPAQPSDRAAT